MGAAIQSDGSVGAYTDFSPANIPGWIRYCTAECWFYAPLGLTPFNDYSIFSFSNWNGMFFRTHASNPTISPGGYQGGAWRPWDVYVSTNAWHHVVLASDNAITDPYSVEGYIDGVRVYNGAGITLGWFTDGNNQMVRLFRQQATGSAQGNGRVDIIRVWNRKLTQSDVTARYNAGMGLADNDQTNLIFGANLDEGSGNTYDLSGSRSASLVSGVTWTPNGVGRVPVYSQSFKRLGRR